MVLAVDAGELERQLVLRGEAAAARVVAAQKGTRPTADDERVAGIVAAALEDGIVHPGEDDGLVGARAGVVDRGLERSASASSAARAHAGKLGRGLDQAQAADEPRGIDQSRDARHRGLEPLAVGSGQAMGFVLDAKPLALKAQRAD